MYQKNLKIKQKQGGNNGNTIMKNPKPTKSCSKSQTNKNPSEAKIVKM